MLRVLGYEDLYKNSDFKSRQKGCEFFKLEKNIGYSAKATLPASSNFPIIRPQTTHLWKKYSFYIF